jgi:Arc/MetJ family transcription regulator
MAARRGAEAKKADRIRKNIDIDAGKLAEARRILGTPNDTATVDQALDDIIFVHELTSAMHRLAAAAPLVTAEGARRTRGAKRVVER